MEDTSETNTKVLSRELFLGVVALKMPIQKNYYLRDMGPFPRYCHILCFIALVTNSFEKCRLSIWSGYTASTNAHVI